MLNYFIVVVVRSCIRFYYSFVFHTHVKLVERNSLESSVDLMTHYIMIPITPVSSVVETWCGW